MSIVDQNGDHIVTTEGVWAGLLKLALTSVPFVLTAMLGFAVWLITTIGAIQRDAAVLAERVAHLSDRPSQFLNINPQSKP